ncbi:MAG TPA: ankyrin repeat domain-containing protein [Thermoanaerobaculia bacterium]
MATASHSSLALKSARAYSGRMPKALRKTLPKDFEAMLEQGDFAEITRALEGCLPDARGGYGKQTALHFAKVSDELTRWLVARGADLNAEDTWGNAPLHIRIAHGGKIDVLLDLGADVHHMSRSLGSPLHEAADKHSIPAATLLLDRGAKIDLPNRQGRTPLELALERCSNSRLKTMAPMARFLLDRGAERRPAMKEAVKRLGESFEFHREGFAVSGVGEATAALEGLYAMFDVPAVPRRRIHDGVSPIRPNATTWEEQHDELWSLLVPSSGPARTVQGEVVRIAGRIADEICRNGGANWDPAYREMACAFETHVRSGVALPDGDLTTVAAIVRALPRDGGLDEIARLGVRWVQLNPIPVPLAPPKYKR